jgi:tetratricopeptide (TPR) repeat protein
MKQVLLYFFSFTLIGCSETGTEKILKVKQHTLTTETMYNSNIVTDVVFDREELNTDSIQNIGRELFLKGIDLYKNKKQTGAAIVKLKASILVFPEAKTYYELGNALMSTGRHKTLREEAAKAYAIALRLNFQPESQIYFKQACLSQFDDSEDEQSRAWNTLNNLRSFFEKGTFDTLAVFNEPILKGITNLPEYQDMLVRVRSASSSGGTLFDLYKEAYSNNVSSFEVKPDKVEMTDFRQSISYDFAKFIPEMENVYFGRDVSNDFYYVGKVKQTDQYTAVLYTSISFTYEEMQPTYTYLAVYNNEGEILSKKIVACQCTAEKIKTVSIQDDHIKITDHKRLWEKPITEASFDENKITGYTQLATAEFKINETGTIVAVNIPQNYNDSNLITKVK